MNNISLETLTTYATAHFSVACLFCYWLLNWFEPRRLASFFRLFFVSLATALFVRLILHSDLTTHRVAWSASAVSSLLAVVYSISIWVKTKPSEVYEEERLLNKKTKANSSNEASAALTRKTKLGFKLGFLVFAISLASMLFVRYTILEDFPWLTIVLAQLQQAGVAMMLGIALFLCVELTFLSSPDALSVQPSARVDWGGTARITMACALLILVCALGQFMSKPQSGDLDGTQRTVLVAARAFGLVMLLATFVVWFIPRRLAGFQKSSKIPHDWISLTLTTWLGVFAFLVAATLPADWPWKLLLK